ncbi:MAG: DUF4981 domain-containing protein [Clostridia bacterium]|nr:DUF4981 domain-containing protein [Clostridia bacterium]
MKFDYNYHRDLASLHVNCEKPRAYFIPYQDEKSALEDNRVKSTNLISLCGDWDFKYYESYHNMDDFLCDSFTTDGFDKMSVPRSWQTVFGKGYDKPAYINLGYAFPIDPPNIPTDIPCGLYCRELYVSEDILDKEIYINFEGVDSCFYLFVNGQFAGYSSVSHMTSEINITRLLRAGVNSFKVLVLKWNVGSYLEDQDKLRMSGIFREVYLLARDKDHISDIFIRTSLKDNFKAADITVALNSEKALDYEYKLISPDKKVIEEGSGVTGKDCVLSLASPKLWSDENPALYTLLICCGNEYITQNIGLREVKRVGKVIYINGKKVKAKGVNRHDSHHILGYTTPVDHMWNDLCIMKAHNVNMVRTSHYPNDPRFLSMCDKIGMYVCDETDLETHGMCLVAFWDRLTDSPEWTHAYLDRCQRMVERDKNHACVIMWSLGNESGVGLNQREMYSYIHNRLGDVIVHCEDAARRHAAPHDARKDASPHEYHKHTDIFSNMYWRPEDAHGVAVGDDIDLPYFLCEYSHAMGNSCGDLKDYWDYIYADDGFFGGCIWEFTDHSVSLGESYADLKLGYGGDYGEPAACHSGNFCVDGLVYPDRRIHSSLVEYKQIIKPFRIKDADLFSGKFTLESLRHFESLDDCDLVWKLEQRGVAVREGRICNIDIAPESERIFDLGLSDLDKTLGGVLTVSLVTNKTNPWAPAGYVVGFEQLVSPDVSERKPLLACKSAAALTCVEDDSFITVSDARTSYRFDKKISALVSVCDNGREMLASPVLPTIWRAPTDNDRKVKRNWVECGYDSARVINHDLKIVSANESKVEIRSMLTLGGEVLKAPCMRLDILYTVCRGEGIVFDTNAEHLSSVTDVIPPMLPRLGYEFKMPEENEKLAYYGRGPLESYIDKRHASSMGVYKTSVTDHFEHYVRPQENMAHIDTEWISVSNLTGHGLAIVSTDKAFSFNCSHFTSAQISETAHDFELVPLKETVVNIDCMHSGIGSASCGPELDPKYRLDEKNISFSFRILPTFALYDDLFEESRRKF